MLNTSLRTATKNEFDNEYFKLKNISVFGKIIENFRNHKDMKIGASREQYAKYVMKPNLNDERLLLKKLFAVELVKTEIKMKKPMHLRQALFYLNKTSMYKFHCDHMQPKYIFIKSCILDFLQLFIRHELK